MDDSPLQPKVVVMQQGPFVSSQLESSGTGHFSIDHAMPLEDEVTTRLQSDLSAAVLCQNINTSHMTEDKGADDYNGTSLTADGMERQEQWKFQGQPESAIPSCNTSLTSLTEAGTMLADSPVLQPVVIGASKMQPAPAVEITLPTGHIGELVPSVPVLEAFPLGLHALESKQIPAGVASAGGTGWFPLQRQVVEQGKFSDIQYSYDEKMSLQTLDKDSAKAKRPNQDLTSQKCQIIVSLEDNMNGQSMDVESKNLEHDLTTGCHVSPDRLINTYSETSLDPRDCRQDNSLIQSQIDKELAKKSAPQPQKLYSRVAAPPNATPLTSGASPECGVSIERAQGLSLETYAWAAVQVTGRDTITYIGHNPADENFVLIFFKRQELAELLVDKGLWIRGKWFNVSFFQAPATKYIISGILPFIPDSLIVEALSHYGTSVYSVLRRIPAAVRSNIFKGLLSFRREIYLVRNETPMPNKITVSFLGMAYSLDISDRGPKCFICGSLNHIAIKCNVKEDRQIGSSESRTDIHLEDASGIPQQKGKNAHESRCHEQEWESWKGTGDNPKPLDDALHDQHHRDSNDEPQWLQAVGKGPPKLMNKQKVLKADLRGLERLASNENRKDKATEQYGEHSLNACLVNVNSKYTLIGAKGFILQKGVVQSISIEGSQLEPNLIRHEEDNKSRPEFYTSRVTQDIKTSSLYNCLADELVGSNSDSSVVENENGKKKKKKKKKARQDDSLKPAAEHGSMEIEESGGAPTVAADKFAQHCEEALVRSSSGALPKLQPNGKNAKVFVFKGSIQ